MYLFNLAWFLGASALPMGVSTPPNSLEMFLCVSGTSKQNVVYGALIEAEILTSPLPNEFAQLGLDLGASALPMGVSTPLK